jgi:hypothetical protein
LALHTPDSETFLDLGAIQVPIDFDTVDLGDLERQAPVH